MVQPEGTVDRWQQVEALFRGAVELPVDERGAFLDAACGDDPVLRRELDELLAADGEATDGDGEDLIDAAVRAGEELLAQQAAVIPPRFGKYEVEGRLGEGGFGVVYRGRDPLLDRPVAIKACSRSDGELRRRFYREARIAAGLRHTNITTVHELGVADGVPYLVQELLPGEDLHQVIGDGRDLSLATRLGYLVEIARGLEHAHGAGVLHRDVKPGNVRILPDGSVKLMDFGIAKVLGADSGLTGTGMTLGTVGYLAPEQLRSEAVDERADIFAFGVLAYELLGGARPFRGDDFSQVSYQLLYREPTPLGDQGQGDIPEPLARLVHRCLAKERGERPGSMASVRAELEAMARRFESGAVSATQVDAASLPRVTTSTQTKPRDGRVLWVRGVLAFLGIGGAVWVGLMQEPNIVLPSSEPSMISMAETAETAETVETAETAGTEAPLPSEPPPPQAETAAEGRRGRPRVGELADPTVELAASPSAPLKLAVGSDPIAEDGTSGGALPPVEVEIAEASLAVAPEADHGTTFDAPIDGSRPTPTAEDGEPALSDIETATVETATVEAATVETARVGPLAMEAERPAAPSTDSVPFTDSGSETSRPRPMGRGDLITGEEPGVVGPRLLRRPQPVYPSRARRRGLAAQVVVKALVDEEGKVLQVIAPGLDEHGFLAAAKEAALGAEFEPPQRDGVAGRMWINLSFDFTPQ